MKKTLEISGMSCGHCVHAVKSALEALDGVRVEDVRLGTAVVDVDDSVADDVLRDAVDEEGYPVVSVQ